MKPYGQLSATLIIGILLIAFLGGLLYQAAVLIKERTKQQLESQTMTQSKITPVHDYIQACLELAGKDSLLTLGSQGGYLFQGSKGSPTEGQGGFAPDFSPSQAGSRFMIDPDVPGSIIPYAIFRRESTMVSNWLYSDPPAYPYHTFPMWRLENDIGKSPSTYPFDGRYHFDGIFGANLLPRLYGPQPLPEFLDPSHLSEPIPSVVEQLQTFILNHTLSCIDFGSFRHSNLAFSTGLANVTVRFFNGTTILLHYPITMTDAITGGQAALSDWITTIPVRFSYLHAVLDFAVSRESDTLLFFMSNLSTPDGSVSPVVRKKVKAENDYIVTYTDTGSMIDGKPYRFRFAVHNRPPALYYLNRTIVQSGGASPLPPLPSATQPGPIIDFAVSNVQDFTVCASRSPDGKSAPAVLSITNRGLGDMLEIVNARVSSPSASCPQTNLRIPLFALDPDEDVSTFTVSVLGQQGSSYIVDPDYADLLEHRGERLKITVIASDGALQDTQELLLPTHYEPPVK